MKEQAAAAATADNLQEATATATAKSVLTENELALSQELGVAAAHNPLIIVLQVARSAFPTRSIKPEM